MELKQILNSRRSVRKFLEGKVEHDKLQRIVDMEIILKANRMDVRALTGAKKMGFSDPYIAKLWNVSEIDVWNLRKQENMMPAYRMVDTCHTNAYIPYFYSSYTGNNDSRLGDKKKIIVLGAGHKYDVGAEKAFKTTRKTLQKVYKKVGFIVL